jgi:hypothetical protein
MNFSFLPKRVGKILADVGKDNKIILRKPKQEAYNPYQESQSDGVPPYTEYACNGICGMPRKSRKRDGSEQATTSSILLRAENLPVTPEPGDVLIVNDEFWTVVRNDTVRPTGKAIMHKLELKP